MIGRKEKIKLLRRLLTENQSNMVAVVGRRRVGKTYLIEQTYRQEIVFNLTGVLNAPLEEQLQNFKYKLDEYRKGTLTLGKPDNWLLAFQQLKEYLEKVKKQKKKRVLFFDELPWLATARSGFLRSLAWFWNDYAEKNGYIVVLCGSAASWMIKKIINDKGGLHNRVNTLIHLKPFSLGEVREFLDSRKIKFNDYQIAQLYMAIGGIPHYLNLIQPGLSAQQNIDQLFFGENALLKNEFQNLYAALFDTPIHHINVVRTLAKKQKGVTRSELIRLTKIKDGGGFNRIIEELSLSSFIKNYQPFGKRKKGSLIRLIDEYSKFYLKFIENITNPKPGDWLQLMQAQQYKSWSGFAFESLCLKHIKEIKKELGIEGLHTSESSFFFKGDENQKGTQIDLIIDRPDNTIHLCEIKFSNEAFEMKKKDVELMEYRKQIFRKMTKTKKHLFTTLITSHALIPNKHSIGLIDQQVLLSSLF